MKCQDSESRDIRLKATSMIWGLSMGMLGISIPLAAITDSPLIPMCVLLMTGTSTVAIWAYGHRPTLSTPPRQQLEDRVANLETIISNEDQFRSLSTKTGASQ